MARLGGNQAHYFLRPQLGAASIAIVTGALLWYLLHRGGEGTSEYVLAIGAVFAPLVMALAFASVWQAAITALGVIIATVSAAAIQLWFRVQAKRSQFRRRQTSSRLATFAEAFCSIGWAATAALALSIPVAAVITGLMTAGILAATWKISPRRE